MSPLVRVPADPEDRKVLDRIASSLARGGLLAYPTETVYGVGGAAGRDEIARVRALKGREARVPFLLLVPSAASVPLSWTAAARALAEAFWPGPLTLVLGDPEGRFPAGVRSRHGGVAVRVSPHPFLRALATHWPQPLLSTSANRAGEPPASSPEAVEAAFEGRPGAQRLWLADGGVLPPSPPSTVLDCLEEDPRVLREGALPLAEIRRVAPRLREQP
jgi:L-threonylcarbamoyladenylate synthase